jgi:hypothetical protein
MSDLESRCEKCEQNIAQLRGELDALRLQMIDIVEGVLARVDEILVKVDSDNQQMFSKVESANRQLFSDLQAQTKRGFADLQASINALPLPSCQRKDDEPPKLN